MKVLTVLIFTLVISSCSAPHKRPSGERPESNLEGYKTANCVTETTNGHPLFRWRDCDRKDISVETERKYKKYKFERDMLLRNIK